MQAIDPNDPIKSILLACEYFIEKYQNESNKEITDDEVYESSMSFLSLVDALLESSNLWVDRKSPTLGADRKQTVAEIAQYLSVVQKQITKQNEHRAYMAEKEKYLSELGYVFCYELTNDELSKIQTLIDQLRVDILESEYFDEEHKRRILVRLEKLQMELHKRMSDFDLAFGLLEHFPITRVHSLLR